MIEPMKAPVRPRVVAWRTRGTVLLEELVAEMLEEGDVASLSLCGPPGAGTTTALQHVAHVFGPDAGLSFTDLSCLARSLPQGASGVITFPERTSRRSQGVIKCEMAAWDRDEWIEYLLAVHRDACGSVMNRLRNDPDIVSLAGNPAVIRQVLDELAGDCTLPDVKSALRRIVDRRYPNPDVKRQIARHWFQAMSVRGKEGRDEKLSSEAVATEPLLNVVPTRILLAAEAAWHDLNHEHRVDKMRLVWHRGLMTAVAAMVRESPAVQNTLRGWVNSSHRDVQPLAVSLLHAADVPWEWPPSRMLSVRAGRINLASAILDGIECPGQSFTRCPMEFASFAGAQMAGVDLRIVRACEACFDHADLSGATLTDFVGTDASFIGANLAAAHGDGALFCRSNLSLADLSGTRLSGCDFMEANLSSARLDSADLSEASFARANLEGADFRNANLTRADLSIQNLTVADFRWTCFRGAILNGCYMEGIDLPDADFEKASLHGAVMTGSVLPQANFSCADLQGARLAEVEWESVDLRGANLAGATFHMGSSRSGLVGSTIASYGSKTGFYTDEFNEQDYKTPEEIRKANLRGADIRGAAIDHVDFYLVDLRDALYDPAQEAQLRSTGAILESRTC